MDRGSPWSVYATSLTSFRPVLGSSVSCRKADSRLGCDTVSPQSFDGVASRLARIAAVTRVGSLVVIVTRDPLVVTALPEVGRTSVGRGSGEHPARPPRPSIGDDLADRAAGKDAAALEDRHGRVEFGDLGEVVRGVDDRGAVAGESRTTPRSWERVWTSAPTVGSSRSTSEGRPTSAMAVCSRRRSPPDSSLARPLEQLGEAEQFGELVDRRTCLAAAHPGQTGEEAQIVATRKRRIDAGLLGSEAEAGPGPAGMGRRIDAADHDPPGVCVEQPGDDRHQRRLAGPVPAQQRRDLTRATARSTESSAWRDP